MKYKLVDRCGANDALPGAELVEAAGGNELLARMLMSRGVATASEAKRFLHPDASQLHDPFLFRDMARSIELIGDAAAQDRAVYVYGDYDADGTCASAILKLALSDVGIDASVVIPRRTEEGYGLSKHRIAEMDPNGLLITVDCGISNAEEVAFATERGMDVIVTDHHACPVVLPEAACILNPHAPGETYPDPNLCGAGVALKLAEAFAGKDALRKYIDLAAFATVADVVPLIGENRVIAALGLSKMNSNPSVGLGALAALRTHQDTPVTSSTVAFELAPAVNAAGRISTAQIAFDLLSAKSPVVANALARTLSGLNEQRQTKQAAVLDEALAMLSTRGVPDFIVLSSDGWDPGVLGPAASRIAEQTQRPTILCARTRDGYVGSGRSGAGVDLYNALSSAAHLVDKFGGHTEAAGLTVQEANLPALAEALNKYMAPLRNLLSQRPAAEYDYEQALPADPHLIESLSVLEPFGAGNPVPIALIKDAHIEQVRPIGSEKKHTAFQVRAGAGTIRAVLFGVPAGDIPPRGDVLGEIRLSTYGARAGEPEIIVRTLSSETRDQFYFRRAVEVLRSEEGTSNPGLFFRSKNRMRTIYKAFRAVTADGSPLELTELYRRARRIIPDLEKAETAFAYCVFHELGLIADQPNDRIQILINTEKCDLDDSRIYRACGR